MRVFLDIFLRLPRHLRFYIWTLLLETWSMDAENQYGLMETDGTTRDVTSPAKDPRGYIILASQVSGSRWMDHAKKMSLLFKAYCEGLLEHVGTVLKLDLHSLFSRDRHYLARAKKILILALQL